MKTLEQFEIGDRLYGYYIDESVLNRFELIISDNTMIESVHGNGYIIAITGDGEEWFIGLENGVLYYFDRNLDMVFTEKPLESLNVTIKEKFKLRNPIISKYK